MKICLFADIHGNGPAFFAAYPKILAEEADLNICLGDLCGYYYDQVEIVNTLLKIPSLVCIRGNHDDIFLQIASGNKALREDYLKRYGHSMENLLEEDNSTLKTWLEGLADFYTDSSRGFSSCYHGSPMNPLDGYVYPDTLLESVGNGRERFIFLGHTHYKMSRTCGGVHIVNPGSLGQPRDGGWPTYAVVDTDSCEVAFHEVVFDKRALKSRIIEMGDENRYLDTVLCR